MSTIQFEIHKFKNKSILLRQMSMRMKKFPLLLLNINYIIIF